MTSHFLNIFSLILILFLLIFDFNPDSMVIPFGILCFFIVISIMFKIERKNFCDPIIVLIGTYFFLILIGTFSFSIIKQRNPNNLVPFYVYGGFLSIYCGLCFSKYSIYNKYKYNLYDKISHINRAGSKNIIAIIAFIGLIAYAFLVFFGGIPILSSNVDVARLKFYSQKGYLNLFFISLPYVSVAFLCDAFSSRDRRKLIHSHLFAIMILFFIFIIGFRGTTIKFVFFYSFTYMLISNTRVNVSKLLSILSILFIFVVIIGTFRRGVVDTSSIMMETGITLNARPSMIEIILNRFDEKNILYGSGYFTDLNKFLPGSQVGTNVDLKNKFFSNAENMPELSGVNPSIIGESYMNFGKIGVFTVLFFLGYLVGISYEACINNRNNFFYIILYMTILLEASSAIITGIGTRLPTFILSFFWIVVISYLYNNRIRA